LTIENVTAAIVALLGLHALLKLTFFAAPYSYRRAALDRAYGSKATATTVGDRVLLTIVLLLAGLLLWRGLEAVSFLGGLWIGGTLIQLYFHRFHEPLKPEEAPPPVVSPIKMVLRHPGRTAAALAGAARLCRSGRLRAFLARPTLSVRKVAEGPRQKFTSPGARSGDYGCVPLRV
jgi:hypothetical protein